MSKKGLEQNGPYKIKLSGSGRRGKPLEVRIRFLLAENPRKDCQEVGGTQCGVARLVLQRSQDSAATLHPSNRLPSPETVLTTGPAPEAPHLTCLDPQHCAMASSSTQTCLDHTEDLQGWGISSACLFLRLAIPFQLEINGTPISDPCRQSPECFESIKASTSPIIRNAIDQLSGATEVN